MSVEDNTSPSVRLRALRSEDSALLYEWITDRDLVIFNAPYHPVSEADHSQWMESMMKKRPDLVLFVIEDLATGAAIGTCQLLNINLRHRSAELQIRIGRAQHQGRGLGSQAIQRLVQFGFQDMNLHRIYLHVFATNERAIASYVKCGFQQEGVLRDAAFISGAWVDVFVMARLASE